MSFFLPSRGNGSWNLGVGVPEAAKLKSSPPSLFFLFPVKTLEFIFENPSPPLLFPEVIYRELLETVRGLFTLPYTAWKIYIPFRGFTLKIWEKDKCFCALPGSQQPFVPNFTTFQFSLSFEPPPLSSFHFTFLYSSWFPCAVFLRLRLGNNKIKITPSPPPSGSLRMRENVLIRRNSVFRTSLTPVFSVFFFLLKSVVGSGNTPPATAELSSGNLI